jgi:dihydrofolate reductase
MSKVIYNMSMSLDGFVVAPGATHAEPLGKGGEQLHEWAFGDDPTNQTFLSDAVQSLGAVIAGRTTYDDSMPGWAADGPTGPARVPTFVLTHEAPGASPENGVYRFVTGGIEDAVREARAVADGKVVSVMGGPDVGMQALRAGLVDEVLVTIAPVLFGGGLRMFDALAGQVQLERVALVDTDAAVHVRYRVVKPAGA